MLENEYRAIERCAWDVLKMQALEIGGSSRHFSAFDKHSNSLAKLTCDAYATSQGSAANSLEQTVVESVVNEVFHAAKALGLIMFPTSFLNTMNAGSYILSYAFTSKGLAFFRSGDISMSVPGLLVERVREVVEGSDLSAGIVPLVEEAQLCWSMGCLRASMVLIGLASEDACTRLLDEMCRYHSQPPAGSQLYTDWKKLNDETASFYTRWQSGLKLMDFIKQSIGKTYRNARPEWWSTWEPIPSAVQPYAEAVRITRNAAAHSVNDLFTAAQVGLLLATLPTMLSVVVEITAFLKTPPKYMELPSF